VGTPARVEEMENVAKGLRKAGGSYKYKLINLYKNCRCGPWMTYVLSFIGFNDYLEVEPHSVGFIVANFSLQSSAKGRSTNSNGSAFQRSGTWESRRWNARH